MRYLNLNNNKIEEIKDICKLKRLIELNLSNNKINKIPKTILGLKKIEKLYLSNNKIKEIPKALFQKGIYVKAENNLFKVPKNKSKLVSFHELVDLVRNNEVNESDEKIIDNLLDAHRDWRICYRYVNEFFDDLEDKVNRELTKKSLELLMKKYWDINYLWELESLTSLLDIFNFTDAVNLREMLYKLVNKLRK